MNRTSSSPTAPVLSGKESQPVDGTFPRWLPAGMCVGPWRVLRWLGQGGYGVVYLAEDTRPVSDGGRPGWVALKLAVGRTPDEDPQARRRLLREGDILSRVVHPHVVRCLGRGEHQGVPYLVLEYVPGPNLYDWLALRNRTAREVVEKVGTLVLALRAAHEAGVFHRDLKGENVLVRESDGQPVLLDFGVGEYEGASTLTGAGLPPGTAHYRSAQAVRFLLENQDRFDAPYHFTLADELYALGIILYRLLADEYPFPSELPRLVLYERIVRTEPAAPVLLNPRVPRSISELVMRLLSKGPEERGGSVGAVYEAIQSALADGDGRWSDFLFDWDDGPSTHSRSTEETELLGPAAPGHEVALMHAAAQRQEYRWEQRRKRALRKRPRLPAPAASELPARTEPRPRRPGTRVMWGLLVVACLSGVLWSAREVTLLTADSPMSQTKEGQSVDTEKARGVQSQEQAVGGSIKREGAHLLEKCAAAAAAGLVLSACAGAPTRPPQRECTREALAAMDELGLAWGDSKIIQLDANQPGFYSDLGTFRDGPIVSMLDNSFGDMPQGTLLYGYLWTGGQRIIGHYDRAKLPTGDIIPVCLALGQDERDRGIPSIWGSTAPGTVQLPRQLPIIRVERFEGE
jgi:eukaryotic-like serine/threonine-protein kinase